MAGILMGGMCLAPSNNTILYGSTCNDFLVYIGSNSQNIAIGVSNSTPLMTIAGSTGNVGFAGNVTFNNPLNMTGIKVTQLTSAISQNMTAQISSFPGFTQKQSGAVQIVVNGPGNSNNIIQLMNSNNNEYMRVASNGFIGINNTNPQFNLDVGGSVNVSSNMIIGSDLTVSGNTVITSNVVVIGTFTACNIEYVMSNITIYNSETVNSNLSVLGNLSCPSICNALITLGTSNVPTNINIMDIANARWNLNTSGYKLSITNDNGGIFKNKMSIDNSGNVQIGSNISLSNVTGNGYISSSGSYIGIGKTPMCALDVNGSVQYSSQLISTVATGTAPLSVTSTTLVTNLNAQYLNGQLGSYYTNAGNLTGTATSVTVPAGNISGAIPVASGGTGVTTSTGTGNNVLSANPILTGNVGIGTSTPAYPLDVNGSVRTNTQFISTVAQGTPPLIVTSSTVVPNLNASMLNGLSSFAPLVSVIQYTNTYNVDPPVVASGGNYPFNTVVEDEINIGSSLNNNNFTLPSGTYEIMANLPIVGGGGRNRTHLWNATTNTLFRCGKSAWDGVYSSSAGVAVISTIYAKFTLASSTTFYVSVYANSVVWYPGFASWSTIASSSKDVFGEIIIRKYA